MKKAPVTKVIGAFAFCGARGILFPRRSREVALGRFFTTFPDDPGPLRPGTAGLRAGRQGRQASRGELDEVAVVGKTLRQLQREAIKAEDRFYKRFNSLNSRDDFDIHCRMDKPTGTLVPRRQCRIQFLMDAGAIDAKEF